MADDESCSDEKWVSYRDRPDWRDVAPVPQDDGEHPVVRIAYSDQFRDVFDYFRAVLRRNERSERALELVTDAASVNPSNYTVWHYRRLLLKELGSDLRRELDYIQKVIEDNPKNYQVWHHRRVVVEWLQDGSGEKAFTEVILGMDAKNYHAWQHRQWALAEFGLWEGELDFTSRLLDDDVRNNSAWNQRFFVISRTVGFTEDVVQRECAYTMECIRQAPHNESPWNYLRGVIDAAGGAERPEVRDFCEALYAEDNCRVAYLLAFLVDLLADRDEPQRAAELCRTLAREQDVVRREYWNFVARSLCTQHGTKAATAESPA
ncbi:farnesyl transferase alpha [Amblyomma americanum]|uniref:Protein farnesyltransferase/geranylgeranyltransferase type-1 subunit alpha n=1 Tax=Amblyomma americanum TaxID=6943 RepID=A0AAQ4DV10_AMBAM